MKTRLLLCAALCALATGPAGAASMHTLVFTSSGTFTIPATAVAGTEFEFTVIAGGGGGGGCYNTSFVAAGGGSGGAGMASFSGFAPSQAVTITVGAGGTAGVSGSNGGSGSQSRVKVSGVNVVTTIGGRGSVGESSGTGGGNTAGTFTATAGTSGLTLASSLDYAAQDGLNYAETTSLPPLGYAIPGGGNPLGHMGTLTNYDGALGGGALGCQSKAEPGGTGGAGVVIVRWAL
ncbi:MAG TPA: hypothetical protein VHZ29_15070 [Rhizomicrobium sp.]|jgi:hypothetical protein|nr:hypothetical protein [Rhizomicrobium sp.]